MAGTWDLTAAKPAWERDGYLVLPGYLSDAEVSRYRTLCDRALAMWRSADPRRDSVTNMAWLTDPIYWRDDREGLLRLCEWVAEPRLLALLRHLSGQPILFNNTQYFAEPIKGCWRGIWHRDCQFLAEDDASEQRIVASFAGVHLHVAFIDDAALSYVPGSHRRRDSAEERAIRKAADKRQRSRGEMPGARALPLKAGDAVLFHAWGLHQGTYDAQTPRRTFDCIYQWGEACAAAPPPPTCFEDAELLAEMTPQARTFFTHFAEVYRPFWSKGAQAWATS